MLAHCPTCNANVTVAEHGEHLYGDPREGLPVKAILASCFECREPMLLGREEYGRDVWSDPWRMYPVDRSTLSAAVPETLRAAYREAILCFKARAYTASAIMCRKVLEAAAHHFGVKGTNLYGSLKLLKEAGHIDAQLHEWASALRVMGNDAVHGVDLQVGRADAEDTVAFTEAIVDYVFVYRQRFLEFAERRRQRSDDAEDAT